MEKCINMNAQMALTTQSTNATDIRNTTQPQTHHSCRGGGPLAKGCSRATTVRRGKGRRCTQELLLRCYCNACTGRGAGRDATGVAQWPL